MSTATVTTHNIDELMELTDDSWCGYPTFSSGSFTKTVLAMESRMHRGVMLVDQYGIFGWEAGSFQRVVQDGPLVEGPIAYMNKKGVALTAHRQEPVREIMVKPGDHLIIRGTTYEIVKQRGDVVLERVL